MLGWGLSHKSFCYLVFAKFCSEGIISTNLHLLKHKVNVQRGNMSNVTQLGSLGILSQSASHHTAMPDGTIEETWPWPGETPNSKDMQTSRCCPHTSIVCKGIVEGYKRGEAPVRRTETLRGNDLKFEE